MCKDIFLVILLESYKKNLKILKNMQNLKQFKVYEEQGVYIAEGLNVAIVTHAETLDVLVKNIEEAVSLHFEGV